MIRAPVPNQDYPFDLQTDRYLVYDSANPAATVEALSRVLKETLASSRSEALTFSSMKSAKIWGSPLACTSRYRLISSRRRRLRRRARNGSPDTIV
jgi:hypothetical protein